MTYSTGKDGQDITLKVAQWSQSDDAQSQYDNLTGAMTGKELGGGNVKVSGEATAPIAPKPIRTTKPRPSRSGATIPWCSKHGSQGFGAALLPAVPAVILPTAGCAIL